MRPVYVFTAFALTALAGSLDANPVKANSIPGLCSILMTERVSGPGDPAEGLDWPHVYDFGAAEADCDRSLLHLRMRESRTAATQVHLKDLHQATYRDPVRSISDTVLKGFVGPKRTDVLPVPLNVPVQSERTEFDRNWRFNLNAWKMIEPMLKHHDATGDHLAARLALDLIRDWARFNIEEELENAFLWYDIAAGQRAMKLAYLIDAAYRGTFDLTDEEFELLLGLGHIHAVKLLDPDFINPGNHGTFQIHGLAALCRAVPAYRVSADADDYIAEQMEMLVRGQYGEEAMHMEHSAEYHFFMHKVFTRLFSTGWYDHLEVTRTYSAGLKTKNSSFSRPATLSASAIAIRARSRCRPSWPRPLPKCRIDAGYDPDCQLLESFTATQSCVASGTFQPSARRCCS